MIYGKECSSNRLINQRIPLIDSSNTHLYFIFLPIKRFKKIIMSAFSYSKFIVFLYCILVICCLTICTFDKASTFLLLQFLQLHQGYAHFSNLLLSLSLFISLSITSSKHTHTHTHIRNHEQIKRKLKLRKYT